MPEFVFEEEEVNPQAKAESGGFTFEEEPVTPPQKGEAPPGFLETVRRGFTQGATFNAGPETGGAVGNLISKLLPQGLVERVNPQWALNAALNTGMGGDQAVENVTAEERARNKEAEAKAFPGTYSIPHTIGTIASGAMLPLHPALAAGVVGGVSRYFGSEGDTATEKAKDALGSGLLSFLGGGAASAGASKMRGLGKAAEAEAAGVVDKGVRAPARDTLSAAHEKAATVGIDKVLRDAKTQRKQLLSDILTARAKERASSPSSIEAQILKAKGEREAINASEKGAALREQLRDQQAVHMYGKAIARASLTPKQAARLQEIEGSLPKTGVRHLDEAPPVERVKTKYDKLKAAADAKIAKLEASLKNPQTPEQAAQKVAALKAERAKLREMAAQQAKEAGVPETYEDASGLVRKLLEERPEALTDKYGVPARLVESIRKAKTDPALNPATPASDLASRLPGADAMNQSSGALGSLLRGNPKTAAVLALKQALEPKSMAKQYADLMSKASRREGQAGFTEAVAPGVSSELSQYILKLLEGRQ